MSINQALNTIDYLGILMDYLAIIIQPKCLERVELPVFKPTHLLLSTIAPFGLQAS